jgi:hypothetical protein
MVAMATPHLDELLSDTYVIGHSPQTEKAIRAAVALDVQAARADERRRCFDEMAKKMEECANIVSARGAIDSYLAASLWATHKRDEASSSFTPGQGAGE